MTVTQLPDLVVSILDEDNAMVPSSLESIRGNKAMVIDFWHTKCSRCPAALEKLNSEAADANGDDIIYISCALSQGEGNHEVASSLVTDGSLENMTHTFMDMEVKEEAKEVFKFTAVPFYVVVDKRGHVIGSGQPGSLDYKQLIVQAKASNCSSVGHAEAATPAPSNTFSLDEDF